MASSVALAYYLYGMERAGRLSGRRFFGEHDWYREGPKNSSTTRTRSGASSGRAISRTGPGGRDQFLAALPGERAVARLDQQAAPRPKADWDNDADDISKPGGSRYPRLEIAPGRSALDLAGCGSQRLDRRRPDAGPIAYFNGHKVPEFTDEGMKNLRDFIEQGASSSPRPVAVRRSSTPDFVH